MTKSQKSMNYQNILARYEGSKWPEDLQEYCLEKKYFP